jgi:hypothetical protein
LNSGSAAQALLKDETIGGAEGKALGLMFRITAGIRYLRRLIKNGRRVQ